MLFIILVLVLFSVDFVIKYTVEKNWVIGKEKHVCKDKLILRKLHNKGAALNLLENHKMKLMILNLLLISGFGVFFVKTIATSKSVLEKVAASMILAGGLNNLYDRIKRGYVVDYFSFKSRWKKLQAVVFNVSDFFIFIGALLLCILAAKKRQ